MTAHTSTRDITVRAAGTTRRGRAGRAARVAACLAGALCTLVAVAPSGATGPDELQVRPPSCC